MRPEVDLDGRDFLGAVVAGLKVYDAEGDLIGTVESIERTAGTMRVATNPFFEDALVVPLKLIAGVDARELFLSSPRRRIRSAGAAHQDGAPPNSNRLPSGSE